MYRRAAVVGRVATSLSRPHPARRAFSESRSLREDDENKPRSRRTIRTDLLDSFGTKPAAAPKEVKASSEPTVSRPADVSSAVPPPAPERPAPTEHLSSATSKGSSGIKSSGAPPFTPPAASAAPVETPTVTRPPKTAEQPAKASPTPPLADSTRKATQPSASAAAPPRKAPVSSSESSKSSTISTPSKSQSANATVIPPSSSPVPPSPKTAPSPLKARTEASPSPKTEAAVSSVKTEAALSTAETMAETNSSYAAATGSQEAAATSSQDTNSSSSSYEPVAVGDDLLSAEDHLESSHEMDYEGSESDFAIPEYDGEYVDVDDIQLPRPRLTAPDPLAEAVTRKATMMANDPTYLLTDIQLGLATERVKQDVLNAGWPLTTLNLQAALIRKTALDKYKKMRKKPPPFIRSLSGFLAQAVGARRAVRWTNDSFRPSRSIDSTRGKLERAQIRVPTNSARLPAAVVAATALPSKPVKLQRQGELDTDMFGFLRMRRNHVQWRQEVAGGDYGRFTAHVPVPETLDPTADEGKSQIAVRSALLALQRNATVNLKAKREVIDIYRNYVNKDTKLPELTDEHPTINLEELVDVLLVKKMIPNRLVGIIRAPPTKSIAPP